MKLSELIPRRKVGLGIDIRGGLLCHALLRRGLGRVHLLSWGLEELHAAEGEKRDAEVKEKLGAILSRLPVPPTLVTVGLPRSLVTMRLVTMPAVGEEELKGILDYEVERHVPFPPEEAEYDFQVLEKDAEKATLLLAAARKDEVGRYLELLAGAGITPTALGVSTFASLNALLYNQGKGGKPVTALIDLRNGEAEIGVTKGGILRYCRYLKLGPAAPLDALLPELSGLLAHLDVDGGQQAGRIALSGAGGGRGDLLHHLADRTGFEVEFLQPFQRISGMGVDPQSAQSLGAAVGLALSGLVELPLRIDLLSKEVAPPRRDPAVATTFRLLALIVALGLAYGVSEVIRERRALADVTARVNQVRTEAAKVEQLKGDVTKLNSQITVLEKIHREDTRKLDLLRELVQILPKGVTLTLLSVEGREVRIGGSITGPASDLISIIEQSKFFENAQFTSPVASRGAETQDFQIKAFIEARREPRP